MMHNLFHIGFSIVLIGLLILLSDPLMLWMPEPAQMMVLLGAAILLCIWAGFVMLEHTNDERETLHRTHAGRMAYLSGIAILTIALIVQGVAHAIDPWISGALGMMVLVKIGARFYYDRYR